MKQVNVKKLILPNIPYVFIALLATKVSEAVRLAPGSDASTKLLNIMTGLNTAFHSLVPSFHPIDLCVGVAAAIAIRLAVYIKGKNAKKFRKIGSTPPAVGEPPRTSSPTSIPHLRTTSFSRRRSG